MMRSWSSGGRLMRGGEGMIRDGHEAALLGRCIMDILEIVD